MDYSPGIRFEKRFGNVDEEKSLAKSNQLENTLGKKRCRWGFTKHLHINSKDLLFGVAMQKAKMLVLEMVLYQVEEKKSVEGSAVEEEVKYMLEVRSGED